MLYSMESLLEYEIKAKDGKIGKVNDFYFDSENWQVRYVIDKTGFLFFGKHILISLSSIESVDIGTELIVVNSTKEEIKNGATIDADKAVSREKEKLMVDTMQWPAYWNTSSGGAVGMGAYPSTGAFAGQGFVNRNIVKDKAQEKNEDDKDNTLRSFDEIEGYKVNSEDGKIGKVEDLIFDEKGVIRYIVVNANNLECEDKDFVLVSPEWMNFVSWYKKEFSVGMPKSVFENCPAYEEIKAVDKEYETALYDHFKKEQYWKK